MKIKVLLIKGTTGYDITETVSDVTWSGAKGVAPRSVSIKASYNKRGWHGYVPIEEGDGVMFFKDGAELFRGIVFSRDVDGMIIDFKSHDNMIYTVKNKDTYLFKGKTATDIFKKVCADFSLPMGKVDDTEYKIPYRLFDGDTLYDMIMTGLYLTFKTKGTKFALMSKKGEIHLLKRKDQIKEWVIEPGGALVDYNVSTSIEDTYTKVKIKGGEEEKTVTVISEDTELQKKFGIIQHYERSFEKLNKAQLQERADNLMKKNGKVRETVQLNNIVGIEDVITGVAIYVVIPELGIKKGYYVENDSHSFKGNDHRMNLTLVTSDELPEVEVGSDEDPDKK